MLGDLYTLPVSRGEAKPLLTGMPMETPAAKLKPAAAEFVVEMPRAKPDGIVALRGAKALKLDMTHAMDGFSGNEHALPTLPLYRDVVQLFAQTKINYTPTL